MSDDPANWVQEYQNVPIDEVQCSRCCWIGTHADLRISYDIEQHHPLNKDKWKGHPDLHTTEFRRCPACKTCLYADGRAISRRNERIVK